MTIQVNNAKMFMYYIHKFSDLEVINLASQIHNYKINNSDDEIFLYIIDNAKRILFLGIISEDYSYDDILTGYDIYNGDLSKVYRNNSLSPQSIEQSLAEVIKKIIIDIKIIEPEEMEEND